MEEVGAIPEWAWECPHCGCEAISELSDPSGDYTCEGEGCNETYRVYQT